jgi:GT2 family glycosyltransferase
MALAPAPRETITPASHAVARQSVAAVPRAQTPILSIVIVNYHQWRDTTRLVQQLRLAPAMRAGRAEVVVVDNHSPANRLMGKLRRWPEVSLRRWGRNRGFARAVNEGCRLSRGDWLLLLNPDMTVPPTFADEVLSLAERLTSEDPLAGIVGFQLRHRDGTLQMSSGPFPTLTGTLLRLALPRSRRKYQPLSLRARSRVPWVTGCCLLVRQDCLRQLGGFDEEFFLYYEDVDLCRRARAEGWSVWYEPGLRVFHHQPLHCRRVPALLRLLTRHALLRYASKHWPAWQLQLLTRIVRGEAWLRRQWAGWNGDARAADLFVELGTIAAELAGGRTRSARRRLQRVVRGKERCLAA